MSILINIYQAHQTE